MSDEKFDDLMRDAAQNYNRPPDVPPLDVMWENIERELQHGRTSEAIDTLSFPVQRKSFLNHPWLRMAAMLAIIGSEAGCEPDSAAIVECRRLDPLRP